MSSKAEEVINLIPEIKMIKDDQLRGKVAAVWADAIELGGWKAEDLDGIPFTLLIPDCKFSLLHHTRAVTRTAVGIAENLTENYGDAVPIDMDILLAGSVLHDVGKVLEYVREGGAVVKSRDGKLLRHPFSGVSLAESCGIPPEVCHIIATHAGEGNMVKRSTEAFIVNHADFMTFLPF